MVRGEQRFTCMLRTGEAMSARDLLQGLTNNRAGVASLRARHRPGHCELGGRTQIGNAAKESQPHWMTPVVTVTPRLEQEFRYDQFFFSSRRRHTRLTEGVGS